MERDFDVIIAGAGPAGAALAVLLGMRGRHVALLDRARFPRRKPCGEFMSPECLPLLEDLGVRARVLREGAMPVRGMTLHGCGHRMTGRYGAVGRAAPRFDHGYGIRREVFDHVLLERARECDTVEVLEDWPVRDLLRSEQGAVEGVVAGSVEQRTLRAPFTVGADGLRSRVASRLGLRRGVPWLEKFALTTRFAGVTTPPQGQVHLFDGGYFAACPIDGGLFSVNLVVDRSALPRGLDALEALFEQRLGDVPVLADMLQSARRVEPFRAVGPLAGTTTRQVFAGGALVGDACGYVDPITGEGIFFALRGAAILAEEIEPGLRTGRSDALVLRRYARRRRREFGPRFGLARLLQRALPHPRVVAATLALLRKRSGLMDLLVSVTGDYVPVRELLRPSVWLRAAYDGGCCVERS